MLPMVYDAMREQALRTRLRRNYVFLNLDDKPIEIETLRKNAWTKGLKKAGIDYRPVIQTRHTFATIMISSGENIGWVQKMLGHTSPQMIYNHYYAWIPQKTRADGSAFERSMLLQNGDKEVKPGVPINDSKYGRLIPA